VPQIPEADFVSEGAVKVDGVSAQKHGLNLVNHKIIKTHENCLERLFEV